jgi:hypothetical protein
VPEDRERPDIDKMTTYWSDKHLVFHKGKDYADEKNRVETGLKGFSLGERFKD